VLVLLKDEIKIVNSVEYKKAVTWYYALESLISTMQVSLDHGLASAVSSKAPHINKHIYQLPLHLNIRGSNGRRLWRMPSNLLARSRN